jgi:S1-C subfamily serine protease
MGRLATLLAEREALIDHVRQAASEQGPSRTGARVSLGTIPAYGATGPGLVIEGTVKGGAAEAAGLVKGDRIVELAGKQIDNVYDYMHVIGTLKAGVAVKIVVMRGDAKVELEVVPKAKE